jgi:hypothetical protein
MMVKAGWATALYTVAMAKFPDRKDSAPREQLDLPLKSLESSVRKGSDTADDRKVCFVLGAVILTTNALSPSAITTITNVLAQIFRLASARLQRNLRCKLSTGTLCFLLAPRARCAVMRQTKLLKTTLLFEEQVVLIVP